MSEIDELKQLLLGEDKNVLDKLNASLNDRSKRSRFVGEVLPEAVAHADSESERLARALVDPVNRCIKRSVERNPQMFADVLFPVMGPSIRKSISETLKQFVQSLNQVLEHSFTIKGLRWRWEAWRSGVSFPAVVLKNTLLYRVEEAYLIQADSGLLIEHVSSAEGLGAMDEDAVSAMLTAIQDFVRDAFSDESGGDLDTLEMGERTVWVIRGKYAVLACVLFGFPPTGLRDSFRELLDDIHRQFGAAVQKYSGDRSELAGVSDHLVQTLVSEAKEPAGEKRGPPWTLISLVVFFLSAVGIAWWFQPKDDFPERRDSFIQAIEAEPGLVLLEATTENRSLVIKGMRDPLARLPDDLPPYAALNDVTVEMDFQSYQSLDPELVKLRVQRQLDPPQTVQLVLDQGELVVSGVAEPSWVDFARSYRMTAGVDSLNLDNLMDDEAAMRSQAERLLQVPDSVELSLEGRSINFAGTAPSSWFDGLERKLEQLDWLEACDASRLETTELNEARELAARLAETRLQFADGTSLSEESSELFQNRLGPLLRLQSLAKSLGARLLVEVVGYSDGTGNQGWNIWLRFQRADEIGRMLRNAGIRDAWIRSEIDRDFEQTAHADLAKRMVKLSISLIDLPSLQFDGCR